MLQDFSLQKYKQFFSIPAKYDLWPSSTLIPTFLGLVIKIQVKIKSYKVGIYKIVEKPLKVNQVPPPFTRGELSAPTLMFSSYIYL